ncbi:MAG TPA: hypothetical protein VH183_10840 [Burkholderiaceae bacterium]|jgi:hypothetical protein|nr:hypothetical protein [Burkholderiaceae bacterium]
MLNRFGSNTSDARTPVGEQDTLDPSCPADFNRLSGDEIERLIALCEAPALLWHHEPAPARAPEPFGMIA